ncbi:MAG: DUF4124 domain-containing protein [Pseudomonadota bacterium]
MNRRPHHPRSMLAGLLCLVVSAQPAAGADRIYRTVDEDGNVVFTDETPGPDEPSETVELEPDGANTFEPPPVEQHTRSLEEWLEDDDEEAEAAAESGYRTLRVAQPGDDEGIRNNAGNVVVHAELEPELQPGHVLQLYLDGTLRRSARSNRIQLANVDRGTHSIVLRVVDEQGNRLISSETSVFHLQRRSVILQP